MRQLSLSNATFEGNSNAYLLDEGAETVLIDSGDSTDVSRDQLRSTLQESGHTFADIDRILLTHWHGDHVGLAGEIQAAGGATVHVHAADAPLVRGDADAWDDLQASWRTYLNEWGVPEAKREELYEHLPGREFVSTTPTVEPITDGAQFTIGDTHLTARHAPGHAAGLCIYERDDGVAFSGDALLPKYTPNVGGADVRVDRPLAKYLATLDAIVTADYDRVWPGHRDVINAPTDRAREIIHHHEERSLRVLDALATHAPCDAWQVSDHLFGALEAIHILHGPGESYAHLEHLCHTGAVYREGNEYDLTDTTRELLDAEATETIIDRYLYAT